MMPYIIRAIIPKILISPFSLTYCSKGNLVIRKSDSGRFVLMRKKKPATASKYRSAFAVLGDPGYHGNNDHQSAYRLFMVISSLWFGCRVGAGRIKK